MQEFSHEHSKKSHSGSCALLRRTVECMTYPQTGLCAKIDSMKLKRLVHKKGVRSILEGMIRSFGGELAVEDHEGRLLLGVAPAAGESLPISLNGQLLGYVRGRTNTAALAASLQLYLQQEQEKRTIAKETLDRYKELTLLYGIAEKISTNMSPPEVGSMMLEQALYLIKADNASVALLDENDKLQELAGIGCADSQQRHRGVMQVTDIAADVIKQGRAEIVNDVQQDRRFIANATTPVSSLMCAPLKVKDKVIGVITISTEAPHTYTADELKMLSSLAVQAASVIENATLYDQLHDTFFSTVNVLAETIEMRDHYTGGHTRRVRDVSIAIGKNMGLDSDDLETLRLAASLHDIGKIGIDDAILRKPGRLSSEEFDQIKRHPEYGGEILQHVRGLRHIVPIVRGHHERYDGKGYPDGLKGQEIHLLARIIAVADAFDAMISHRPYRRALPLDVALAELNDNKGAQFDPHCTAALLDALNKGNVQL